MGSFLLLIEVNQRNYEIFSCQRLYVSLEAGGNPEEMVVVIGW